jgi:hypothetical protein
MGEMVNAYKVLVRRPEGKRPLVRPRSRWEESIRVDLKETVWEGKGPFAGINLRVS